MHLLHPSTVSRKALAAGFGGNAKEAFGKKKAGFQRMPGAELPQATKETGLQPNTE
jgi:hypothetical protein